VRGGKVPKKIGRGLILQILTGFYLDILYTFPTFWKRLPWYSRSSRWRALLASGSDEWRRYINKHPDCQPDAAEESLP
jgi:hypothetical protein